MLFSDPLPSPFYCQDFVPARMLSSGRISCSRLDGEQDQRGRSWVSSNSLDLARPAPLPYRQRQQPQESSLSLRPSSLPLPYQLNQSSSKRLPPAHQAQKEPARPHLSLLPQAHLFASSSPLLNMDNDFAAMMGFAGFGKKAPAKKAAVTTEKLDKTKRAVGVSSAFLPPPISSSFLLSSRARPGSSLRAHS